tara:strand:+ start:1492 stop:1746 length:255 start_codon:yes stop_codon:yes gene_type:complete
MFNKTKNIHKYGAWFLLHTSNPPRAEFIKAYSFKSKDAEKARKIIKEKGGKNLTLSIIRLGGEYDRWIESHKKKGNEYLDLGTI